MLTVENLNLTVGDFRLRDVSLAVGADEYLVLMGQTGSGKSLLVQCICGLVEPDAGSIIIGGLNVTAREPRARRVGYVPQEGGLFPHMNVQSNITFPLRVRGVSGRDHLRDVIDMLGLGHLLRRRVRTLSGGEQQKVALARALVSRPALLVLDEPVSALDEPTRRDVCRELLKIRREWHIPTLHICHNSEEAKSLADRVAVMADGQIVQTGTLTDLRASPADDAVARLLKISAD